MEEALTSVFPSYKLLSKYQASNSGLTAVVAAGNQGQDACNSSPAAAERVITVGGLDSQNRPSTFEGGSSNTGFVIFIPILTCFQKLRGHLRTWEQHHDY
jgi:hypothetical protein